MLYTSSSKCTDGNRRKKLFLFFIDNDDNGNGKKQVVQHGVETATWN